MTVTTGVMRLPGVEAPRGRTPSAAKPPNPSPDSRKDTLIATLCHELRQPLSALLGAVEVLRLSPDAAIATHVTAIMRRQIDQMSRVIDDLMEQSRWALGLSVAREIVAMHGGRIDARSEGAGQGSEFVVVLPAAAPPLGT